MRQGAVSGVIRFLCHLPFGYYAFMGVNHFNFVKDHKGVLLASPLGPRVLVGETFAGPLGVIGFLYNFFFWIPTIRSKDGGLVLLGVVDAIIAVLLIISLSIEASYIGFTYKQCSELRSDAPHTLHLLLFQRIAEIEATENATGEVACQGYAAKWYAGLIVIVLYIVSAVANIIIGTRAPRSRGYHSTYRRDPFTPALLSAVPPIQHFVPTRMQNKVFFARRYIRHWLSHINFAAKRKVTDYRTVIPRLVPHASAQEKGLQKLLTNDVVETIVQHLDYVDVVNLSVTSKSNREALFSREKLSAVTEKRALRYYSCWGNEKSDCWACGIQTCKECSQSMLLPKSTVSFHMSLCATACSRCYYKTLSHTILQDMNHSCLCYDGRTKGFVSYSGAEPNHRSSHQLCKDCSTMTPDEILAVRERRDQAMYLKLTQQPLSCSICLQSLSRTGPRWWLCSRCKKECRNSCHLGWSEGLERVKAIS